MQESVGLGNHFQFLFITKKFLFFVFQQFYFIHFETNTITGNNPRDVRQQYQEKYNITKKITSKIQTVDQNPFFTCARFISLYLSNLEYVLNNPFLGALLLPFPKYNI